MGLEYRVLGRTGYRVSVLTIGGCGPGLHPDPDEAVKAVEEAIGRGVNMVDIAPSYGEAEDRLGDVIERYRARLVIAEKTLERSYEGAWRELRTSLKKLRAGYFDIYQLHAIGSLEELDRVFSEKGAIKAFLEAREQGLIRYIGITAHKDMRIVLRALERFDFDTVLIPVYAAALTNPRPENDFRPVLRAARDREVGVIAIKSIAMRRWREGKERKYLTWYRPFDSEEDIQKAINFTLSQEGVATYPMACDIRLWPKILRAAENFRRLSEEEQARIVEEFREKGAQPLFP